MHWLLIGYGRNLLSQWCTDILQSIGQTVVDDHQTMGRSLENIKEKIVQEKPDRIILLMNEENRSAEESQLVNKLNDRLLIPIYVCQATAHSFSPIPILLLSYVNDDILADPLSIRTIIQHATDELIRVYPHVLK
jgi:hypothetical protein